MSTYCAKCGQKLEDGARFCDNCGAPADPGRSDIPGERPTPIPPEESPRGRTGSFGQPGTKGGLFEGKKKFLLLLIIIIPILCGALAAVITSSGYSAEYSAKLDEAHRYVSDEDIENAELTYKEMIKIEPREEVAYLELADLYVTHGRYDEAIDILDEGKTNTGKDRKFDKKIDDAKAAKKKSEGGGNTGDTKETGNAQALSLYSDHMAGVFDRIQHKDTALVVNESQQTYVYDADDDGLPETVAYSYMDTDPEFSNVKIISGFCTVEKGKTIVHEFDDALAGMASTQSASLYFTPDKKVYLWRSKASGTPGLVDLFIAEYTPQGGKYVEKVLSHETLTYEECDSSSGSDRTYIPAEAEKILDQNNSPHIKTSWSINMQDAAGFLSMSDISVLPKGSYGKDWKKAYEEYFADLQKTIPTGSTLSIAAEDINGDKIPEIFLIGDTHGGTVNSRYAQCHTFARGQVVSLPIQYSNRPMIYGGGRDIRLDRKSKRIYFDGITGSYGNDQTQFIAHIGHNGFVVEESHISGWVPPYMDEPMTRYNFGVFGDERTDEIFSQDEFQTKEPLDMQDAKGNDIVSFIKGL